ncbi:ROK family protein [Stappia sp.]|uniref:ROK family protein n=1 Tax=Stappia sp. TaxID=1870903 RepID=UPI003A98D1BC
MPRRPLVGQGSNSVQLRRYNERIVLQVLRRVGEASKADLARLAQLTNAAIGGIIQDLAAGGMIETLGKRHSGGRGQPATMLQLAPNGAFGFGVRLDRTLIETVVADFSGHIIGRRSHDRILPSPEEAVAIVASDIAELIELVDSDDRERIAGVGLAMPFNLGAWLPELGLPTDTFAPWDGIDFKTMLEEAVRYPVFFENDGTAAAIAELFSGIGQHEDDFLYLFMGPAIGGGVVYGGDCLKGVNGNAGDIAMIPVSRSGLTSAPPPRGVLDILLTRASIVSLKRHIAYRGHPVETRAEIEQAIAARNPAVDEWLEDCVAALAPAIWSAISVLDVPLVVIDFDIDAGLPDRLLADLEIALQETAPEARRPPRLMRGSFGPDAGAAGAANLPIFFNYSPRAAILTGRVADKGAAEDGPERIRAMPQGSRSSRSA